MSTVILSTSRYVVTDNSLKLLVSVFANMVGGFANKLTNIQ